MDPEAQARQSYRRIQTHPQTLPYGNGIAEDSRIHDEIWGQ